jgi:hypothetical protein
MSGAFLKALSFSTHQDETLTFHHNLVWLELELFFQNGLPVALPVHKLGKKTRQSAIIFYLF